MSKSVHEIEKRIEKDEWTKYLDKAYETANAKVKIDGFRQGTAPKSVFMKKYGVESLYNDAIDNALNDVYATVLKESKLLPVTRPAVDVVSVDESACVLKFVIKTEPEVTLGDYKKLGIKKDEVKISKKDVDAEIKNICSKYTEMVIKDGKVELGDTAIIDFEGSKDGELFDGGTASDHELVIGSNTFIPGFEDALIGLKKGDVKDVELTFPKDYHAEHLAGADVVFKTTIKEIKTAKLPEMDEEFFKDLNMEGVTSKKELEDSVKKDLEAKESMQVEDKFINDLLTAIAKNVKVDIHEEMIEEEVDRLYESFMQKMQAQGVNEELYFQFTNSTKEQLRETMSENAKANVTHRLMLKEISKVEKIEVTDEVANAELDKLVELYKMEKEALLQAVGGLELIKYDLLMRKTFEFLKENN